MTPRRSAKSVSIYGAMAGLLMMWLCATIWAAGQSAAPPASVHPPAAAALDPGAAHPHAMGALAVQTPASKVESAVSTGCIGCHTSAQDPHPVQQSLSCVDCHGGKG